MQPPCITSVPLCWEPTAHQWRLHDAKCTPIRLTATTWCLCSCSVLPVLTSVDGWRGMLVPRFYSASRSPARRLSTCDAENLTCFCVTERPLTFPRPTLFAGQVVLETFLVITLLVRIVGPPAIHRECLQNSIACLFLVPWSGWHTMALRAASIRTRQAQSAAFFPPIVFLRIDVPMGVPDARYNF